LFDRIAVGGFLTHHRHTAAATRHVVHRSTIVAMALAAMLAACGGNDGDSSGSAPYTPPPTTATQPGTLETRVQSALDGQPVAGATVAIDTGGMTTSADGSTSLSGLTQVDRLPVTISAPGYAPLTRFTAVTGAAVTTVPAQLSPVAATVSVDAAAGGTAAVAGTTAQVTFPAGALVTSGGAAPTQPVLVQLTPIATALDPNLLTGDYRTSLSSWIETYGGLSVVLTDAAGASYTLATGQPATVRIPASTRASSLPPTLTLYRFDPTIGFWVADGTATLNGTAPNAYYQGTVTRDGTWTVGSTIDTVQVTGCVSNLNGSRVARARVEVDGVTYSGTSWGLTNSSGIFTVPMRRNATAAVVARTGTRLSNARGATATTSNVSLGSDCLVFAEGTISIKLTWGLAPADVDSHLLTPQGTHISYQNKGSLTVAPYANLDIDDVTSYGPEFITIRRVAQGTYRYFLDNFSNTFNPGMTGSPVKVEVTYNGNTQVFTPGAGEGTFVNWHAFDIVVNNQCAVTFTPVGAWSATEPVNPNPGGGTVTYCN
jgi:hypothetical protein